jgi:hypothetical protein
MEWANIYQDDIERYPNRENRKMLKQQGIHRGALLCQKYNAINELKALCE